MEKGELQFNKWHFKFGLVPVYFRPNTMMFHLGIFKITSRPPKGEMISKKYYKGFWIRKEFHGFEISF